MNSGEAYNQIHIYNAWGIGDSLANLMFFNHILEYLKINNIIIIYYLKYSYIYGEAKLYQYITSNTIILKPIDMCPPGAINLWIANDRIYNYKKNPDEWHNGYDTYFINFFNSFLKNMSIPIQINTHYYKDPTILTIYHSLPDIYKNVDILFINSVPISESTYIPYLSNWDKTIALLSKQFKIVTTVKVNSLPCTTDNNLSIKDIGALSTHAKYIVAVNTGPLMACNNFHTKEYVKKWFIFTKSAYIKYTELNNAYSYENIEDILPHLTAECLT